MSGTGHRSALLAPLAVPTRADEVTDRLVTAIAVGEYLPGSRLPAERDLATALSVGRVTVRAALARLADRGLIVTRRGREGGSFVVEQWPDSSTDTVRRTLDARWEDLRDRCDALARLHGTVCRAAAEARTAEDVVALRQHLDAYRDAPSGLARQRADSLLHLATIDAAHSPALAEVLRRVEAELSIGAPAHPWGEPVGMAAMEHRALGEHEALVAAITDGRADDAESIARTHVGIDLELLEAARARATGPPRPTDGAHRG